MKLQVNLMTWLICHLHFAVSQFLGTHAHIIMYMTHTPLIADPVITNFRFTPNTMVGDRLNVECEVMGIPTPVITWLKDNVMLSSGPGIDISRPFAGNMFLSQLMIDNADAGVYTCVGTNPAGTVSREISVEVNGSSGETASLCI